MSQNNIYTKMQRDFYNATADNMAVENHRGKMLMDVILVQKILLEQKNF